MELVPSWPAGRLPNGTGIPLELVIGYNSSETNERLIEHEWSSASRKALTVAILRSAPDRARPNQGTLYPTR